MCGRYTLTRPDEIRERFSVEFLMTRLTPRFNVAPTQPVLAVAMRSDRRIVTELRRGLIPWWSKHDKAGYTMINARAETLIGRPAYRDLLSSHRCLVPADGFYEWKSTPEGKQPMYIHLKGGGLFAFAGLYDRWKGPDGPVYSVTIITTTPNNLMEPIHNRMPVILDEESEERWLDSSVIQPERLLPLLRPLPSTVMEGYAVSTLVNKADNELPECVISVLAESLDS